jgi:hypothetical protein
MVMVRNLEMMSNKVKKTVKSRSKDTAVNGYPRHMTQNIAVPTYLKIKICTGTCQLAFG